ncbi:hypothetical protein [Granulicella sp. L60]|uniref:hypothetical protein n=1 Tax=Granulicella sp. L60 TaxID=1641866 RepID=UPI00131D60C8|nr:hypothetical protein [Granulicella sp. L60]
MSFRSLYRNELLKALHGLMLHAPRWGGHSEEPYCIRECPTPRSKQSIALMQAGTAADPSYDASRYNTYPHVREVVIDCHRKDWMRESNARQQREGAKQRRMS